MHGYFTVDNHASCIFGTPRDRWLMPSPLPISDPPPAPSAALTAMGQHSEKVRAHLMDTAGHLFAQQGIDVLSNRAIAQAAGAANHSHFGGREGLLTAMIERHLGTLEAARAHHLERLTPDTSVHDALASHLEPWLTVYAILPTPSWRSRFFAKAITTPAGGDRNPHLHQERTAPAPRPGSHTRACLIAHRRPRVPRSRCRRTGQRHVCAPRSQRSRHGTPRELAPRPHHEHRCPRRTHDRARHQRRQKAPSKRIAASLKADTSFGPINHKKVARIMKAMGL